MADGTGIEWSDATWNPVVGCSLASPGCTRCYAMRLAARLARMGMARYAGLTTETKAGPAWTGEVRLAPPDTLLAPLRWQRPRRIFVTSMGDLFHEAVPDAVIDQVFGIMALAPQHTFQVLTKRADRMAAWFAVERERGHLADCIAAAYAGPPAMPDRWRLDMRRAVSTGLRGWPLPNVWLGVSAEDQARADERLPALMRTPARVRFVSCEPLLEGIDLTRYLGGLGLRGLDWVIAGGESGPRARPCHPQWIRSLRWHCVHAGVAFFFKQWGEWSPMACDVLAGAEECFGFRDGTRVARVGRRRAGDTLDGLQHHEWPR